MERPIDPVLLKLTNGEERKLLLSFGGLRRLKQKFQVKSIQELMQKDSEEAMLCVLFESVLDKGDMTLDQFADLVPAHVADLAAIVGKLFGQSMPAANPPVPTPVIQ